MGRIKSDSIVSLVFGRTCLEGSKISTFETYAAAEHSDVVVPTDFAVWRADVAPETSKAVRFVHQYFEDKKKGRTFNRRRDLNPPELAAYLPYITILEAIDDPDSSEQRIADARFRLIGTKVSMLYGEATGKLVSEHHGEEILGRVRKIADFCVQEKCDAVGRSAALAHGRSSLEVTILYVPFSDDDIRVNQFLIFADICRLDINGKRLPGDRLPEVLSGVPHGFTVDN